MRRPRLLASAQHFQVAEKAASDLFIKGPFLISRQNGSFYWGVTGTEFGCCQTFSCKRKYHVILVHSALKGEAGLKSIGI